MWEKSVHYVDGWFVYADGEGHCSIISQQRARDLERRFLEYQASQDVQRGGLPREIAYPQRGFVAADAGAGHTRFELADYSADAAARKRRPVELAGTIEIPRVIGGFKIDEVCDEALAGCGRLEKIVLPESVTAIGDRAFYGCSRFVDVVIPECVVSIGEDAFYNTQFMCSKGSTW